MLPADGEFTELGLVAELSEPLIGPDGEVALLSVAEPGELVAALPLGFVALPEPMLLLAPPAVEPPAAPPPAAPWANAAGANATTDNARPAPNK
jgi:hypothetical protein